MPKLSDIQWTKNRQAIVDIAFQLFAVKGYTQVSVNDIIREAQISKGGFYTYFQSKQEVFLAIAERSDASKANLASQLDSQLTPAERIGEYIKLRLNNFYSLENRHWAKFAFEFWATIDMTEEMSKLNDHRFDNFTQDLTAVIQEGIDCGDFKKDLDIAALVYVILAIIDGCASMTSVMNKPLNAQTIHTAADVIVSYLKDK